MKHGEILKSYIKKSGISVESFIDRLAKDKPMSRQTLYNWYEKNEFDDILIERLVKIGKVPSDIFAQSLHENYTSENKSINNHMQKLINAIEKAVSTNEKLANEVIEANAYIRNYLKQNNIQAKIA